jgi:hypothetical protein
VQFNPDDRELHRGNEEGEARELLSLLDNFDPWRDLLKGRKWVNITPPEGGQ